MTAVRYILFITISLAIMVLWGMYFAPPREKGAVPPPGALPVEEQGPDRARPEMKDVPPGMKEDLPDPVVPHFPEQKFEIAAGEGKEGNPRLRLLISNRGAGIEEARLPEFESHDRKTEMILIPLDPSPDPEAPLTLGLSVQQLSIEREDGIWEKVEKDKIVPFEKVNWKFERLRDGVGAGFVVEGNGLEVTKKIWEEEGGYHVNLTLSFENRSQEKRRFQFQLWGAAGLVTETVGRTGPGSDLSLVYGKKVGSGAETFVEVIEVTSISGDQWSSADGRNRFIGSSNNYFVSFLALVGEGPTDLTGICDVYPDLITLEELAESQYRRPYRDLQPGEQESIQDKAFKNFRVSFRSPRVDSRDRPLTLAPGERATYEFIFFLGPREEELLAEYPELDLSAVNKYAWDGWGWWTVLVKLFLRILKFFHWLLHSWGLAIVGLTVMVRLALHPLSRRQQGSMMRYQKKMGAIKPQMDQLKERYGSNRMKMNQEMQKLFKENNVNPGQMMGGCLLMFLQFPVWIALFSTIRVSLDLRHTPFLWITDLTQPDRLIHLPFSIPYLGDYFNVLPVIYVILTILQQKMQPKPTDPQMQQQMKMMSYMMVLFGFIFYDFPSAFLIYFIASSAIGMVESKLIKKSLAKQGLGPLAKDNPDPVPASEGGGGGSGPLYPGGKKKKKKDKK